MKNKWIIGGIVGGVLLLGGVGVVWGLREMKIAEERMIEERKLAEEREREAERVAMEKEKEEKRLKEEMEKQKAEKERRAKEEAEKKAKEEAEKKAKEEAERKAREEMARKNNARGQNGGGLAPYYIKVSRNENVMMVYGKDREGNYGRLVKVFLASTGKNNASPLGVFIVDKRFQWRWAEMIGGAQAQYVTRITGLYLIHSVPYYTRNQNALKWEEYNKLGQQASLGCVRLQLDAAKWIYENVTTGTKVEIYEGPLPAGIQKPVVAKIDGLDARRDWDPTNPAVENPWKK